jgi:hypothetical protein
LSRCLDDKALKIKPVMKSKSSDEISLSPSLEVIKIKAAKRGAIIF